MDFVAIDIETANAQWGSVCAFGAVEVVGGTVAAHHGWLTRPPAPLDWFDGINSSIHGIRPHMVAAAPTFAESLVRLLEIIDGRAVVAHNAAFDIGNIRRACTAEGMVWPRLTYGCSLVMARRTLDLPSYSLPYVCDALGIDDFGHHDAAEDAAAAAEVTLHLAQRHAAGTVEALAAAAGVRLGELRPDEWRGCVARHRSRPGSTPPMPDADHGGDPDHLLFGKTVVFTGGLAVPRREAAQAVAALGAQPQPGVTRRTDFLVIGDGFTGRLPEEFHTGKAAKAVRLREQGHPIEILTEADLMALLAEPATAGSR